MKKKLIFLIFLIMMPSAYSLASSVPKEREIFFEPDKQITLQYVPVNQGSTPIKVEAIVSGPLANYFQETKQIVDIEPFSHKPILLELTLPSKLKSGLYPIHVELSEVADIEGMGGLTAIGDVINVISPFENGYPYGTLSLDQYKKTDQPLLVRIQLQNIGKTALNSYKTRIKLKNEKEVLKNEETNTLEFLMPFEKGMLEAIIDPTGIQPGIYTVETEIPNGNIITKQIALGKPTITIFDVPLLKADAENSFTVRIGVENWATPISDAQVKLHINQLIDYPTKMTLYPGPNEFPVTAQAKPGKSGTYKGRITVIGDLIYATNTFTTPVEGSKGALGGVGFRKTEEKIEEDEPEPEQALSEPKTEAKNTIFLLLLLIASFAVFSFALGQYLARRKTKDNDQPPITPP